MRRFLLPATLMTLLVMAMAVIAVVALGAIQLQAGAVPPPPEAAPTIPPKPKIAAFNMAKVMKEFRKAKERCDLVNEEREKLSADLAPLRVQYVETMRKPDENEFKSDEKKGRKLTELAKQIEDKAREIDKKLDEKEEVFFAAIYDDIKTVVDKCAELNGYEIVFAYVDGVSEEELKKPALKELKLKSLTTQPFHIAKHIDVTGVVIQTLNVWYPLASNPQNAQLPTPPIIMK